MFKKKHELEERMIIEDVSSRAGEAYQRLQVNIQLASVDNKFKTIGLTSSSQGEGKTTTLVNLANIFSKKNKKIIILDLDLRKPSVHFYFRKPNETGLVDYVTEEIQFDELIQHTNLGIDFINVGKHTPFPAEILESKKLAELIEKLKEMYDIVFLDCPPMLVAADTAILSKYVDGFIVVCRANSTTKDMFGDTIRALRNTNSKIIGTVLTSVPMNEKDYNFYGYDK